MPEYPGTINAIEHWESIAKGFVELGFAELVKDGKRSGSADYVNVYNIYVGSGMNLKKVCWRFHYDERDGAKCHFRVSDEGMDVIRKSMTVMVALRKLNMELANGDKYDLEKLRDVMEEALVIVENRKKGVIQNVQVIKAKT